MTSPTITPDPIALTANKNSIAYAMFFDTADLNYIGARAAFFEQRDWDFWWLSLHALEKYLKTILLVNGRSAKIGQHNINELLDAVAALDMRLVPPAFSVPRIEGIADAWHPYPDAKFYERLNDYGSAHNRYGTYGYTLFEHDLFRLDQLIFWARRHCRPRTQYVRHHPGSLTIDWIDALASSPSEWVQHRGPLEKIGALPPSDHRRWPLARLNAPFFPKVRHRLKRWRSASSNPPIARWAERLRVSAVGSSDRAMARGILEWVVESMTLAGSDKKILTDLLANYP